MNNEYLIGKLAVVVKFKLLPQRSVDGQSKAMTNTANILQPFPSLKLNPKFLIHEPEVLRSDPLYFTYEAYDLPLTALYIQRSTVGQYTSVKSHYSEHGSCNSRSFLPVHIRSTSHSRASMSHSL